jgi:hypothetical protein
MKYRGLFSLGKNDRGREAEHSTSSSAEVKNEWMYMSIHF